LPQFSLYARQWGRKMRTDNMDMAIWGYLTALKETNRSLEAQIVELKKEIQLLRQEKTESYVQIETTLDNFMKRGAYYEYI